MTSIEAALQTLLPLAILGSGLSAGIFYAFSSFVMAALGALPERDGAAAMRAINVTAINASFMVVFLGTAALSAVMVAAWTQGASSSSTISAVAASGAYLVGVFGVTLARNVPLNNRLADVYDDALISFWPSYLRRWTFWNHVRTAAAMFSFALFVASAM